MNLNNAEVAVTTQHLIDTGQPEEYLLTLSDYGDMDEFLRACSLLFPKEKAPEYRYTEWDNIPEELITKASLLPNFFELREALEQTGEEEHESFINWCRRHAHNLADDDPYQMVSHYMDMCESNPVAGGNADDDSIYPEESCEDTGMYAEKYRREMMCAKMFNEDYD